VESAARALDRHGEQRALRALDRDIDNIRAALDWALAAGAAELAVRTTGLARRHGKLLISVGVPDIIQPSSESHLTSGFATKVLIRVALFHEGTREAVATTYRLADIVYDLWDEKFRVQRTDAHGRAELRDAADVARAGLEGLEKGKRVVVPGVGNRAAAAMGHYTPRFLLLAGPAKIYRRAIGE
jgi:hypothetical protein